MKFYDLNSKLDFGQYKGEELKTILDKNPKYIDWCFQKVDYFCISDEIFKKLPIIEYLVQQSDTNSRNLLANLKNSHQNKKDIFKKKEQAKSNFHNNNFSNNREYEQSNWLSDTAGTDDPEIMNDVYWNLD